MSPINDQPKWLEYLTKEDCAIISNKDIRVESTDKKGTILWKGHTYHVQLSTPKSHTFNKNDWEFIAIKIALMMAKKDLLRDGLKQISIDQDGLTPQNKDLLSHDEVHGLIKSTRKDYNDLINYFNGTKPSLNNKSLKTLEKEQIEEKPVFKAKKVSVNPQRRFPSPSDSTSLAKTKPLGSAASMTLPDSLDSSSTADDTKFLSKKVIKKEVQKKDRVSHLPPVRMKRSKPIRVEKQATRPSPLSMDTTTQIQNLNSTILTPPLPPAAPHLSGDQTHTHIYNDYTINHHHYYPNPTDNHSNTDELEEEILVANHSGHNQSENRLDDTNSSDNLSNTDELEEETLSANHSNHNQSENRLDNANPILQQKQNQEDNKPFDYDQFLQGRRFNLEDIEKEKQDSDSTMLSALRRKPVFDPNKIIEKSLANSIDPNKKNLDSVETNQKQKPLTNQQKLHEYHQFMTSSFKPTVSPKKSTSPNRYTKFFTHSSATPTQSSSSSLPPNNLRFESDVVVPFMQSFTSLQ